MVISISAVIAVVAVLLFVSAKVRNDINERGGCPECGTEVPGFRKPTSLRQALWGGWTCAKCGTEMDRGGRELSKS